MMARFRILYWIVLALFLVVALAETGFFVDTEGRVVGKKTFRIWGMPMGRRLIIKYQEPGESEAGRLVIRYNRVPVTQGVYEKFKKGDKLEHNKFSFVFFAMMNP
jgi:hypothetical protein